MKKLTVMLAPLAEGHMLADIAKGQTQHLSKDAQNARSILSKLALFNKWDEAAKRVVTRAEQDLLESARSLARQIYTEDL